jgi:hypothetical protein
MSFFDNLKKGLHDRKIKQKTTTNTTRKLTKFSHAKNIGVLFIATEEASRKAALQYKRELQSSKKKVTLLGYYDAKEVPTELPFLCFGPQHLGWDMTPSEKKAPEVIEFIQQPFDLLIAYHNTPSVPLEYIATASKAKCRVAPYRNDCTTPYDLMLHNKSNSLRAFANQAENTLNSMNK